MEEVGSLGLLLALLFIGFVVYSYIRAVRSDSRFASSVALGLGFGLFAILIHSFSDFAAPPRHRLPDGRHLRSAGQPQPRPLGLAAGPRQALTPFRPFALALHCLGPPPRAPRLEPA